MNVRRVVVIGAGMGGLTAAVRLAQLGHHVRLFEARPSPGGLASGCEHGGVAFDSGPYIILDRPGLEWAFDKLGIPLDEAVVLDPVDHVYQVAFGDGEPLGFFANLETTVGEIDRRWPGAGLRYRAFVESMRAIHGRTRAQLFRPRPDLASLISTGAWRDVPFLLRSLGSVLTASGLPEQVQGAIAIWTHVAGQPLAEAPSPMAFVAALIHSAGAFYARDGVGAIPAFLARRAAAEGVELHYGAGVRSIRTLSGHVRGAETCCGAFIEADAVVSNAHGVATYLELLDSTPERVRSKLSRLRLQSPGVCAYLRVHADPRPPYLSFRIPGGGEPCRLLVMPGVVNRRCGRDGWWPARLIAPLHHEDARRLGTSGQRAVLHRLLEERWWRHAILDYEVLATRVPAEWGAEFRLYRDSMNPVMTARAMRAGRLAHRSPWVEGLYLAGSSTHPGQWVSFCAISGILAAEQLHRDLG